MRQKAINLDQDKMRTLFPSLTNADNATKFSVQVDWFFDSHQTVEVVQKIGLSEKNWRLNSMPWVDHDVTEGDIIVCQILGDDAPEESRIPTGIALALVRPGDQGHEWLDARLPPLEARSRGGFITLDDGELLDAANWDNDSAIWQLAEFLTRGLSDLISDVITSAEASAIPEIGLRSIERTGTTREAIEILNRLRSAVGLGGETLIDALLEHQQQLGEIASYEWVSLSNATAPVDFRANESHGQMAIEVKTTKGLHDARFIISVAELLEAQRVPAYQIWRVSGFTFVGDELSGSVRRSDPAPLVAATLSWLADSPHGVDARAVEFTPSVLTWSDAELATCPVGRVPSDKWPQEINLAAS